MTDEGNITDADLQAIVDDTVAARFALPKAMIKAMARELLASRVHPAGEPTFKRGDRVEKISGSSWRGHVCGEYSTSLTPEGYAVESENEPGSVQIFPVKALTPGSPL